MTSVDDSTAAKNTSNSSYAPDVPLTVLSPANSVALGETCGCDAGGDRGCTTCLLSTLASGEPCALSPLGVCVSSHRAAETQAAFDASYQASNRSGLPFTNEFFYSTSTRYCGSGDSVCVECRARWSAAMRSETRRAEDFGALVCRGAGDCVCTVYCELRAVPEVTLSNPVNSGGESCELGDWSTTYAANVTLMRNVVILIVGAFIIAMTIGTTPAFESSAALFANGALLRLLIDREQQQIGVKVDEVTLSVAPNAQVIVEDGDGFRPMSPSQLSRLR